MQTQLTPKQIKNIIISELPKIIETDRDFRRFVLDITKDRYADKEKTEERIDRILDELRRDREKRDQKWDEQSKKWEEQNKKWKAQNEELNKRWKEQNEELNKRWKEQKEELNREQDKRWKEQSEELNKRWKEQKEELNEEHNKRWKAQNEELNKRWKEQNEELNKRWKEQKEELDEEHNKRWREQKEELNEEQNKKWKAQNEELNRKWDENQKALINRYESSIGALGARWGLQSEKAFRDGLKSILEESFGVKVERYHDVDPEGIVFGRPDQIELDVIIYNGTLILCEIKSSVSKSDMYSFWKKTNFYTDKHKRKADRILVISPMTDRAAADVAEKLGIEVFGYADEVTF